MITECHGCGAPKTGRDCDVCGIISCDGCSRFTGPTCSGGPCKYTPGVVAAAEAVVRQAAEGVLSGRTE